MAKGNMIDLKERQRSNCRRSYAAKRSEVLSLRKDGMRPIAATVAMQKAKTHTDALWLPHSAVGKTASKCGEWYVDWMAFHFTVIKLPL